MTSYRARLSLAAMLLMFVSVAHADWWSDRKKAAEHGVQRLAPVAIGVAVVGLAPAAIPGLAIGAAGGAVIGGVRKGISDSIVQAYGAAQTLENNAATIAKTQEGNVAYLANETLLQANSLMQDRIEQASDISKARLVDFQISVLRSTASVETTLERIVYSILICVIFVACFLAIAREFRRKDTSLIKQCGKALTFGALAIVLVVICLGVGPLLLSLTGHRTVDQQIAREVSKHMASFAKAMKAQRFKDAVAEAGTLRSFQPENPSFDAAEAEAKLFANVFGDGLLSVASIQGPDVLRRVAEVESLQIESSTQRSEEADNKTSAGVRIAEDATVDPDLLTTIAYVTASNASTREADAAAALIAETALKMSNGPTSDDALDGVAQLILDDYCDMPLAISSDLPQVIKLQKALGIRLDVPSNPCQDHQVGEANEKHFTVGPQSREWVNGLAKLRENSRTASELLLTSGLAYTEFLDEWFRCTLPDGVCTAPPASDPAARVKKVQDMLDRLQTEIIFPWQKAFVATVVRNGDEPQVAVRFARLDDGIYVRAQGYVKLLTGVKQAMLKKASIGSTIVAPASEDAQQLVWFRTSTIPPAGGLGLVLSDATNSHYPKKTGNTCEFDEIPDSGEISIHSRWSPCYVTGLGRDPLNTAAATLEASLIARLHNTLTNLQTVEIDYLTFIQAQKDSTKVIPVDTWKDFLDKAVAMNLITKPDAATTDCGTREKSVSFACKVVELGKQGGMRNVPELLYVKKRIAESPSLRLI